MPRLMGAMSARPHYPTVIPAGAGTRRASRRQSPEGGWVACPEPLRRGLPFAVGVHRCPCHPERSEGSPMRAVHGRRPRWAAKVTAWEILRCAQDDKGGASPGSGEDRVLTCVAGPQPPSGGFRSVARAFTYLLAKAERRPPGSAGVPPAPSPEHVADEGGRDARAPRGPRPRPNPRLRTSPTESFTAGRRGGNECAHPARAIPTVRLPWHVFWVSRQSLSSAPAYTGAVGHRAATSSESVTRLARGCEARR